MEAASAPDEATLKGIKSPSDRRAAGRGPGIDRTSLPSPPSPWPSHPRLPRAMLHKQLMRFKMEGGREVTTTVAAEGNTPSLSTGLGKRGSPQVW